MGVAKKKNAEFRAENEVFWPKIHFFAKSVQLFCYHHDRTTKRQHFCVDLLARRASGGRRGPILARKSAFFYATPIQPPFLRVGRTRLNGIISPPYPEVTLDNLGFPVGGRLAARRAVFQPPGRNLAILRKGHFPREVPLILDRGQRNLVGPSGPPII